MGARAHGGRGRWARMDACTGGQAWPAGLARGAQWPAHTQTCSDIAPLGGACLEHKHVRRVVEHLQNLLPLLLQRQALALGLAGAGGARQLGAPHCDAVRAAPLCGAAGAAHRRSAPPGTMQSSQNLTHAPCPWLRARWRRFAVNECDATLRPTRLSSTRGCEENVQPDDIVACIYACH